MIYITKCICVIRYPCTSKQRTIDSVGIKSELKQSYTFPKENETKQGNLKDIVTFDMTGAIKIEPEDLDFNFEDIPDECILSDMDSMMKQKTILTQIW